MKKQGKSGQGLTDKFNTIEMVFKMVEVVIKFLLIIRMLVDLL